MEPGRSGRTWLRRPCYPTGCRRHPRVDRHPVVREVVVTGLTGGDVNPVRRLEPVAGNVGRRRGVLGVLGDRVRQLGCRRQLGAGEYLGLLAACDAGDERLMGGVRDSALVSSGREFGRERKRDRATSRTARASVRMEPSVRMNVYRRGGWERSRNVMSTPTTAAIIATT
jgi:hypothetical protein